MDDVCSHMKILPTINQRYIYEISKGIDIYIGLSVNPNKRFRQHVRSGSFDNSYSFKIVSDIMSAEDARHEEDRRIIHYTEIGYNVLNQIKGGSLGKTRIYWTKKRCFDTALLCKSRVDFSIKYPGAYQRCTREKWINEACIHMKTNHKPMYFWTRQRCFDIGLTFKTKKEFRENASSAYQIAYRNGWLDDICDRLTRDYA